MPVRVSVRPSVRRSWRLATTLLSGVQSAAALLTVAAMFGRVSTPAPVGRTALSTLVITLTYGTVSDGSAWLDARSHRRH